jgi:hypothetical protein
MSIHGRQRQRAVLCVSLEQWAAFIGLGAYQAITQFHALAAGVRG